jgi:hypothetical protein
VPPAASEPESKSTSRSFETTMPSRDDALVDLLIPVLNEHRGTSFALRERPDRGRRR